MGIGVQFGRTGDALLRYLLDTLVIELEIYIFTILEMLVQAAMTHARELIR